MGVLPNNIRREELKIGDHIYSWRRFNIYAHHGIYVGDGMVIHFTQAARQETGAGNVFDDLIFSSAPYPLSGNVCTVCGDQSKDDGTDKKESELDDDQSKVDGIDEIESKLDANQAKVDGIDKKESELGGDQSKLDGIDQKESKLFDDQSKVDGIDEIESKVDGIDKKESKVDGDQSKVDGIDKKNSEPDGDQSKVDGIDKKESKPDDDQSKVDGIDEIESELDANQAKVDGIDEKESELDGDQSKVDGIDQKKSELDGDQSKLDGDQSNIDGTQKRKSKLDGVICSCLGCFLSDGDLYRYQYGVDISAFLAEPLAGTSTLAFAESPEQVLQRAKFLLANGFGAYNLFKNNCIDFAIYCKTSLLVNPRFSVRRCGQVASLFAASSTFILSNGFILRFLAKRCPYVMAVSGGLYCGFVVSKLLSDIGVRPDATKIAVEELVNGRR